MANAILAAILSFLIPGLGQAYAGNIIKGIIFFVIAVVLALFMRYVFTSFIFTIVELIYAAYAAFDAYKMARYG